MLGLLFICGFITLDTLGNSAIIVVTSIVNAISLPSYDVMY